MGHVQTAEFLEKMRTQEGVEELFDKAQIVCYDKHSAPILPFVHITMCPEDGK